MMYYVSLVEEFLKPIFPLIEDLEGDTPDTSNYDAFVISIVDKLSAAVVKQCTECRAGMIKAIQKAMDLDDQAFILLHQQIHNRRTSQAD